MLYIRSSEIMYLITESVYPLINTLPFLLPPTHPGDTIVLSGYMSLTFSDFLYK